MFRGFTQTELAEVLGVTKQAVSQYETGIIEPNPEVLEYMSEVLSFPLEYFSKPYKNDIITPIFFRKRKTSTKKIIEIFKIYIQWMTGIYSYIEEYIHLPKLNLITRDGIGYTDSEISDIATELRRHWGLGEGPISNLTLLLENNGVIISKVGLDAKKVDACSLFFTSTEKTSRPMVFLTSGTSAVRSRRDLAHELGHQVLHSWMDKEEKENNEDLIEREAETFASYFLMPENAMRREAYAITSPNALLQMKKRWGASAQSILYHVQNIGGIEYEEAERLKRNIYRKGWRTSEPGDDNVRQEKPELIKDALMMITDNNIKTPFDIVEDLSIPSEDITALCGLPTLFFKPHIIQKPKLRLIKG